MGSHERRFVAHLFGYACKTTAAQEWNSPSSQDDKSACLRELALKYHNVSVLQLCAAECHGGRQPVHHHRRLKLDLQTG